MLKMALFDCAINEKCCSVNGGRGICPLLSSPPRGISQLKSPHSWEFAIQGKKKMLMSVDQPGAGGLGAGWIDWCVKGSFFSDVVPLYSSAAASLKSQISYKLMNGQPDSGSHCCLFIPTFYFAFWRFTVHQIWHVHIKEVPEVKFIYKVILDSCYLLIF